MLAKELLLEIVYSRCSIPPLPAKYHGMRRPDWIRSRNPKGPSAQKEGFRYALISIETVGFSGTKNPADYIVLGPRLFEYLDLLGNRKLA